MFNWFSFPVSVNFVHLLD